jgi:xanthine dehydrogenase accessory factor
VAAGLDVSEDDRRRLHTPAGLDIGARTPEEIALAILAEIVSARRTLATPVAVTAPGDHEGHEGHCCHE